MSLQHPALSLMDRLPAELMEQILDDAKHDTRTLLACLRVCVAWHFYLIYSLYEPIRLHSSLQLDQLARAAHIYPAVRDRLASTRAIVLSQHDRLAPRFAHVFPLVLSPYISKVEHLSFVSCLFRPLHPSFFVVLPRLKEVRRLSLTQFYLGNFAEFQRIVCAFPLLEELDLAESRLQLPSQRLPMTLLIPYRNRFSAPRLTTLRINKLEADFLRDLVAWMFSPACSNSIHTLDIAQHFWNDLDAGPVNALLTAAAPTVVNLRMQNVGFGTHTTLSLLTHAHVHNNTLPPLCHAGIGCRHCFEQLTHLRVLDITLTYSQTVVSSDDLRQELCNILASVTSPALERIRLELDVGVVLAPSGQDLRFEDALADLDVDPDASKCVEMHAVLARPAFMPLARGGATVVLTSRRKLPANVRNMALGFVALLRALFAPWRARGVVRLVGGVRGSGRYVGVVVESGADPRWVEGWLRKHARNHLLAELGV